MSPPSAGEGSGRAVGNQVECRPVPVSLLRGLGGVGSAAPVEDGADGLDVGLVGRLGEFEREQHRQVFELARSRASCLRRRDGLRRRDSRRLVSVVVFAAAVVVPSQLRLQLGDCGVERGVKVGPVGFGAHGAALVMAEDRDPLARLGLAGTIFVVQLDVVTHHVAVVPLQADQPL
jgi:hypothetical protein